MLTETKGFKCWRSDAKGSVIDLVMHVRGVELKEAARFLADDAGMSPARANGSPSTARKASSPFDPDDYARKLKRDHEALQGLGLSPETLERFQAGYVAGGRNNERLAVRIDDPQGKFVTFVGIALKSETPKLKFGSDSFSAGSYVFNVHRVQGDEVRLVRDVVEVMTIYEQTGEDCICFLVELIGPEQDDLMSSLKVEKNFACYI